MSLSNQANDIPDESSLTSRSSQRHYRSLNKPPSPGLQQPPINSCNNASNSDGGRDNDSRLRRRFSNPFAQFFRGNEPSPGVASNASSLKNDYRLLPLLIGCIVPISILINVPSITSPWVGLASYNETLQAWSDPEVIEIPPWLKGIIVSAFVMAIACNICILLRFLERFVYQSVVLSLITATIQDILCICAVVSFGILYPLSKGYVYLEGFWAMIASIVFSFLATILISIDLHRTHNFRLQGSGVTHKQRLLIAEAMALCIYLAIGALVCIYLEKWTFLDAMFFAMVTITTIGFGDKAPVTTGGRIFVVIYAAGGIVLLALAINAIRYVILEDLNRRFAIRSKERRAKRDARRKARRDQRARQEEQRLQSQGALERLQEMEAAQSPVDLGASTTAGTPTAKLSPSGNASEVNCFTHFPLDLDAVNGNQMRLPSVFTRSMSGSEPKPIDNSDAQRRRESDMTLFDNPLQDALETMSPGSNISREHSAGANVNEVSPATQARTNSHSSTYTVDDDLLRYATPYPFGSFRSSRCRSWLERFRFFRRPPPAQETMPPRTLEEQREADKIQAYRESMKEYQRRLRYSAALFLTFWLVGAIMFTFVESWGFGSSMYFVFISFSTIGYGDLVPSTMAGRSIFLAYCLVGVVTLTSLASLISEVLSKSMRKHVVESQLRRSEQLKAMGDEQSDRRDNNTDLEQGIHVDIDDAGAMRGRPSGDDESDGPAAQATEQEDKTCHGTLRNLIKVSKSFDEMLRKILGLEYTDNERRVIASSIHRPHSPSLPVNPNPMTIVNHLETEEDESEPSFLSPSISRDINSTNTIQRHSLRPSIHQRRHSHDPRADGTLLGSEITQQSDSNHLQIPAWPNTIAPSNVPQLRREQGGSRGQASTPPSGLFQVPISVPVSLLAPQHTKDGMISIPAVQWQSMIEYSRRFKALTVACEEALEKIAEWEASEKRLRQKRSEARILQRRRIDERRKRLRERRGSHGVIDDDTDEEEELEELNAWDEEGSEDDDEDEDLDHQRARIAADLLGSPPSASPATQSGPGLSPRQFRSPLVPLVLTLRAHIRHQRRAKSEEGHQAHSRQQDPNQGPNQDQVPDQNLVNQAIDTRYRVPLDVVHRTESAEQIETPVASSAKKGGAVGSPSCPTQSDRPLLSLGTLCIQI